MQTAIDENLFASLHFLRDTLILGEEVLKLGQSSFEKYLSC